jgi:7-cyano-7-deazaguanine reductase
MRENPLGKSTEYPGEYDPTLLFAIERSDARAATGIGPELPFRGTDIWNAWELTWLDPSGKPIVATAVIAIDATSPNIVESKSLKLYLNSLAMTRYASSDHVAALLESDLSGAAGDHVVVTVTPAADSTDSPVSEFPGLCIDDLNIPAASGTVDARLLRCEKSAAVTEELHSHLLRSNCPVTNQPDMGSVLIRYSGPKIDRASLLSYIVSYRQHNDFHEACVERIFLDIKRHCAPASLTVYARYNRRGGLDINPFRTDTSESPDNLRLWRQ